ncbi:LOG family protein [Patescibacteria group bacterium]|nr:LOG family protein [Patescibacteria group bacterium]
MMKTNKKIKRVAFFGDAMVKEDGENFKKAMAVAKLLAKNGFIVVDGGGPGIMLAASRGAKEAGGVVEVVVLDPSKEPGNYEGTNQENLQLADRVYTMESYPARLEKLLELADAYVIFDGGVGTLSEVGMTWEMAKFNHGHHEPLVFFGDNWGQVVQDLEKGMNYEKKEKDVVFTVDSPEKVLMTLTKVEN